MSQTWVEADERAGCVVRFVGGARQKYSSYLISGFAELAQRHALDFHFADRADRCRILGAADADFGALSMYELAGEYGNLLFCVDGYDGAGHINVAALERCQGYFKINHCPRTLERLTDLSTHLRRKIHPINPGFPVRIPILPQLRHRLSDLASGHGLAEIRAAAGFFRDNRPIGWLRRLRRAQRTHDVHFVVPYYEDGHRELNEFRGELIRALRLERRLRAVAGFFAGAGNGGMPPRYRDLVVPRTSRADHLAALARTHIAIYVRGTHDCLSFKLAEYLSLGLPIIGQIPRSNLDQLSRIPAFEHQFAFETPEAIVRAAVELVAEPERVEGYARSNAAAFDRLLSPVATAASLMERLTAPGAKRPGRHALDFGLRVPDGVDGGGDWGQAFRIEERV